MTTGSQVWVHYGKTTGRPRVAGALEGTIKRPGKVEAIYGGMAAVRLWSGAREGWGEIVRVGLNALEVRV